LHASGARAAALYALPCPTPTLPDPLRSLRSGDAVIAKAVPLALTAVGACGVVYAYTQLLTGEPGI